jgi:hypothetical protein
VSECSGTFKRDALHPLEIPFIGLKQKTACLGEEVGPKVDEMKNALWIMLY